MHKLIGLRAHSQHDPVNEGTNVHGCVWALHYVKKIASDLGDPTMVTRTKGQPSESCNRVS